MNVVLNPDAFKRGPKFALGQVVARAHSSGCYFKVGVADWFADCAEWHYGTHSSGIWVPEGELRALTAEERGI